MIVTRWQGQLLVVLQPDHGVQTGLIARAWGNEDVPPLAEHERASELAARHHDDGWAIWERHPTLEPATAQPVQFHAVAPIEHIAAYRAGIERAAQLDPWTGLMVSMHGAGLYNDRYGSYRLAEAGPASYTEQEQAVVTEFLADMAELQLRLAGLSASHGHHPMSPAAEDPLIRHHYLLLQVWDRLSLQFAFRHARDGEIAPLPYVDNRPSSLRCGANGTMTLTLDPYPFIESETALPVRGYLVSDRAYTDPEDFVAALTAARPTDLECRALRPR